MNYARRKTRALVQLRDLSQKKSSELVTWSAPGPCFLQTQLKETIITLKNTGVVLEIEAVPALSADSEKKRARPFRPPQQAD